DVLALHIASSPLAPKRRSPYSSASGLSNSALSGSPDTLLRCLPTQMFCCHLRSLVRLTVFFSGRSILTHPPRHLPWRSYEGRKTDFRRVQPGRSSHHRVLQQGGDASRSRLRRPDRRD